MRADAVILLMVDRAKCQRLLERTKGGLDFETLFVAECNIFGRERIVGGLNQILSIKALHRFDGLFVDRKFPRLSILRYRLYVA